MKNNAVYSKGQPINLKYHILVEMRLIYSANKYILQHISSLIISVTFICYIHSANAAHLSIPVQTTIDFNTNSFNMPGTITTLGTMMVSTGSIKVGGNWINSGTFSAGSGTTIFTGSGTTNQSIYGTTSFYNLTCASPGNQLTFESGQTQTINATLTLTGETGNNLYLRSTTDGTQWKIDPQGARNVSHVDVKDSLNMSDTPINPDNWVDSGNNTNWITSDGGDGGSGGAGPAPPTLEVLSTSPDNGAAGVEVDTTVSATFSLLLNGSTVITDNFYVSDADGNIIEGVASANQYTATFTPSENLSYDTTYTAIATAKIQAANHAGTQMNSDYLWHFTSSSQPVAAPSLTAIATPSVLPSPTIITTPSPILTSTPSPLPLPTLTDERILSLSKEIAYLSGDTVVVTVEDEEKNTNPNTEDILITAITISGENYYIGNGLLLDLNEDGINSGTFLATIKTGTITTGGADAEKRSNSGTVKAIQDGIVMVTYSPGTLSIDDSLTKKLSFSSFDAMLAFDNDVYKIGDYAKISLFDAESNANNEEAETLIEDLIIGTSLLNATWVRMLEVGSDTGIFRGSIEISDKATLVYESIQAAEGDAVTASFYDKINTTGCPRLITEVCFVTAMTTPTVAPMQAMPSPSPSPSPTVEECSAESITAYPEELGLAKDESAEIVIKVTGENDCLVEGVKVKRVLSSKSAKRIEVTPISQKTDENGQAAFTILAKKKKGTATVKFKARGLKQKAKVSIYLTK